MVWRVPSRGLLSGPFAPYRYVAVLASPRAREAFLNDIGVTCEEMSVSLVFGDPVTSVANQFNGGYKQRSSLRSVTAVTQNVADGWQSIFPARWEPWGARSIAYQSSSDSTNVQHAARFSSRR